MSRAGSNIGGVAIFTACAVVAGWIVLSRNQAEPTASVDQEEVLADETDTPRRRASRARTRAGSESELAAGSSTDSAPAEDEQAQSGHPSYQDDEMSATGDEESAGVANAESSSGSFGSALGAIMSPAAAADEGGDARTIMQESQRRSEATFYRYDGLLQSFDTKGKVTDKRWTFDRVGSNGRSKAVLRFSAPAEVKGVALLIHNHPERASDQWMWTPALQRDRRIALQDRSTRFFGTDFSFEDLEERDVEQYDYAMLGSDSVDGAACWKIETTPKKSRSSHYSRSIAWIRKDNYLMVRLDNFVDDEIVKRLTTDNVENVQGIWTARVLEMADLRRSTRTRLTLREVGYNTPVNDREFTLQGIRN